MSAAAREAELELLTLMYDSSKQVKPSSTSAYARDILASVDWLCSRYRYSHRIPRTSPFTAVFPEWAKDVIRADSVRELAHDNDGRDVLAINDEIIEGVVQDTRDQRHLDRGRPQGRHLRHRRRSPPASGPDLVS